MALSSGCVVMMVEKWWPRLSWPCGAMCVHFDANPRPRHFPEHNRQRKTMLLWPLVVCLFIWYTSTAHVSTLGGLAMSADRVTFCLFTE